MATDFNYNNKTIAASGPFKPTGKDMPVDARTRVETYADIASIPNPHVGLKITVKVDETNNNKMTDYIVKSLKANSMGNPNSVVDEVVRYVDYLGVSGGSSGGGSGEGLTPEQAQQLQTAYEHSQSNHVSMDEVNQAIANAQLSGGEVDLSTYATKTYTDNAISTALDGHTFKFLTQAEYDALTTKDPLVEYHITDATDNNNIDTSNLASNLSLTGTKLQLKNSNGNLIGNAVTLPSSSVGGSVDLSGYYTKSETYSKTEVDNAIAGIVIDSGNIELEDYVPGSSIKLDYVYGNIVSSVTTINGDESTTHTFTVNLDSKPTSNQIVNITNKGAFVNISPTLLTFTPSNYSTAQTVTVELLEDPTYDDWNTNIILSSDNVESKIITVNATNITVAPEPITSITLNQTSLSLREGESATLTATKVPSDTTLGYAWKSSDETKVKVNNGIVNAIAEGSATITCYAVNNETVKAECSVTVTAVSITSITLPETASVSRNRTITLTPTIEPSEITTGYSWSVDNENATVSNGVVSGVTAGTSIVKCYSNKNSSINDTCTITISELEIESISLDSKATIKQNKTLTLTPTITPSDATVGYTWSVDNDNVTVENGVITAVNIGTSVVTCKSNTNEEIKATCTITVIENVLTLDNISVVDDSLFAVFDSRDAAELSTISALPNRIEDNSENGYCTVENAIYQDDGSLKVKYIGRTGYGAASSLIFKLLGFNSSTYKNPTISIGYKNMQSIAEDDPNYFLARNNSGSGWGMFLALKNSILYSMKESGGTGKTTLMENPPNDILLTLVWDTDAIKCYINGEYKTDIAYTDVQNNARFDYIKLGSTKSNKDYEYNLDFKLFTAYTRVLTAEEILANYNAYIGG